MRRAAVIVVLCSACGGGSPATPTPAATVTPPSPPPDPVPVTTTISGTVMSTNGGRPMAGVSLIASTSTVQTNAAGQFTLRFSGLPTQPYPFDVRIEGAAIITRQTNFLLSTHAITTLEVFTKDGFDADYYQQLARGTIGASPARTLRPWTRDPLIYIHTIDDRGRALDPEALRLAESTIRETIGDWTGGRLKVAAVDYGNEDRNGRAGTISVTWGGDASDYCGQVSSIGSEGTIIEMDTRTPGCRCAGIAIDPAVVRHELGHALGFYHTDRREDIMFHERSGSCRATLSSREREYANYMYSRPRGNAAPDVDPSSAVFSAPR